MGLWSGYQRRAAGVSGTSVQHGHSHWRITKPMPSASDLIGIFMLTSQLVDVLGSGRMGLKYLNVEMERYLEN